MNKSGLLKKITDKGFDILGSPEPVETDASGNPVIKDGLQWYIVSVLDNTNDEAVRRNVGFYVKDEGELNEKAFFHKREPVKAISIVSDTKTSLLTYILEVYATEAEIERYDEVNKFAVVRGLKVSGQNMTDQRYFIQDIKGVFTRKEIN